MLITIFTPTFNRAYRLKKLYESLILQTNTNFEWIIVDDGSTDNTEELINSFIIEEKISILYLKQPNSGKHIAINYGVQCAKGELFFIVDSDDYLYNSAIKKITYYYNQISTDMSFAGVCGLRTFFSGESISTGKKYSILDCNSIDFKYKYHINGDMAEVYRTDILRQYKFPEFKNEKFCPESLIWNRIAQHYKLRYFYEGIYYCEYLPDGLSAKITKLRIKNPISSCLYYAELKAMNIPLIQKIKGVINYWRFAFYLQKPISYKLSQIGIISAILLPISFIFYIKDRIGIPDVVPTAKNNT